MNERNLFLLIYLLLLSIGSCRKDVELFKQEDIQVEESTSVDFSGFYVLNEGNMGSNKSTLDFLDFKTGVYQRNIYASINPAVPKELGDVGNDLAIYGQRLYAVINASNKVEVMDARTAKRIGQIDIPNCRYIEFDKGFAYITSYAGPIEVNPNYTQKGYVARVDTATLQILDKCIVGFQPDGLAIVQNKLYVANSGGYMGSGDSKNYERTVSVIDLTSFKETHRIDVDYNLHHIVADKRGNLWVSSRGDYKHQPSRLYFINTQLQRVTDTIPMPVSNFYLHGDSLFMYSVAWSYITYSNQISYGILDTRNHQVVTQSFITDGSEKAIEIPYGILVHPNTREIFITDAGDYVSPGMLYCFSPQGVKKWSVRTGDIPAHMALLSVSSTNSSSLKN